ncbi:MULTISPECIES: hypothetical protein [Sporosarcina]|uniref:hypothetical protein n=1 Tax=Sporosarcina TaxID=1569 RepID=UPI00058BE268|nr:MULTISPECIES: hypothetical protein [Sporosarcina]WJY27843.1 hypothetical protein QWT68_02360 [Sporosarcina sp. 0.2-SM1T-5]
MDVPENAPENSQMTVDEAERYGRDVDARNRKLENTQYLEETPVEESKITPPLSEEEIKKRTGAANYENVQKGDTMNSVNS